jgi:hypothetical protein
VAVAVPVGFLVAYWSMGASFVAVGLTASLFFHLGLVMFIALAPKGRVYLPPQTSSPDFDAIAREILTDDEFIPYADEDDVILKRFKNEHHRLDLRAVELRQEAERLTDNSDRVIRDGLRLKHRLLSVHLPRISLTACVLASAVTGSVGEVVANWTGFALTPFQRIIVSAVAAVALLVQIVRLSHSYSSAERQLGLKRS